MALIPIGEWLDRRAGDDLFDAPEPVARTTIVVPLRRRRAAEPVHARLRSHARRAALRRAIDRWLAASAARLG
jgi:hypothetical protein